jgi:hypothetical protein
MDFQTLIDERVNDKVQTLEIYGDEVEEKIYLEATISEPVINFITDVDCNKFRFPNTLRVIDIDTCVPNLNLDLNIPNEIKQINISNKNFININLMKLFPPNTRYRYIECNLNNVGLNSLINKLYNKYFSSSPKYVSNSNPNVLLLNNFIYSSLHSDILDEIRIYDSKIAQGKQFCKTIKEELVAGAWHPDRVEKWIYAGIDLDDL